MEKIIGRYLQRKEVVHHINENKLDNRVENLKLFSLSEHGRFHMKGRKNALGFKHSEESKRKMSNIRTDKKLKIPRILICKTCNIEFKTFPFNKNRVYCSNKCKYSRNRDKLIDL